jgi:hypothetical protein
MRTAEAPEFASVSTRREDRVGDRQGASRRSDTGLVRGASQSRPGATPPQSRQLDGELLRAEAANVRGEGPRGQCSGFVAPTVARPSESCTQSQTVIPPRLGPGVTDWAHQLGRGLRQERGICAPQSIVLWQTAPYFRDKLPRAEET